MEHLVAALAARRFYLDGRSKKQIADELGVSRFKVARILEAARRDGVVRIEVDVPPEVDLDLSERLTAALGLRQAVVVRATGAGIGTDPAPQLGRACAALLAQRLTDEDVLGVSWGRTLHALVDGLPALPRADVVQLVGAVPSADLQVNSLELLRRLGGATGGAVHALHVPMVLESAGVAGALRADEHVAATLSRFADVTVALVGIGAWRPGGSSLRSALPAGVVRQLDAAGAVADVCSAVLDDGGREVGGDAVPPRCVAITGDQLRQVPDVIALAGGAAKGTAIAAAARAGLVHRLITDTTAAEAALAPSS